MKHSPGRHSSPHPFALRADAVRSAPWRALPRHGVFLKVRFMGHVLRYTDTILKEQKGAVRNGVHDEMGQGACGGLRQSGPLPLFSGQRGRGLPRAGGRRGVKKRRRGIGRRP